MDKIKVGMQIPDHIKFADLKLARDPDGMVSFDWEPIEAICHASGVDIDLLKLGPEDNASALINAWYRAHINAGGEPDPVQEDLIAEIALEDAAGSASFAPGRA